MEDAGPDREVEPGLPLRNCLLLVGRVHSRPVGERRGCRGAGAARHAEGPGHDRSDRPSGVGAGGSGGAAVGGGGRARAVAGGGGGAASAEAAERGGGAARGSGGGSPLPGSAGALGSTGSRHGRPRAQGWVGAAGSAIGCATDLLAATDASVFSVARVAFPGCGRCGRAASVIAGRRRIGVGAPWIWGSAARCVTLVVRTTPANVTPAPATGAASAARRGAGGVHARAEHPVG